MITLIITSVCMFGQKPKPLKEIFHIIASDAVSLLGNDGTQRLIKLIAGTISMDKLGVSIEQVINAIQGIEEEKPDTDEKGSAAGRSEVSKTLVEGSIPSRPAKGEPC